MPELWTSSGGVNRKLKELYTPSGGVNRKIFSAGIKVSISHLVHGGFGNLSYNLNLDGSGYAQLSSTGWYKDGWMEASIKYTIDFGETVAWAEDETILTMKVIASQVGGADKEIGNIKLYAKNGSGYIGSSISLYSPRSYSAAMSAYHSGSAAQLVLEMYLYARATVTDKDGYGKFTWSAGDIVIAGKPLRDLEII